MPDNIPAEVHVWQEVEITLTAAGEFDNPYTNVEAWVELSGPGFAKRCEAFWDGGNTFRARVLATAPGRWCWKSFSRPGDAGLSGKTGQFTAVAWTAAELRENPLRRGILQASENGHGLCYADGEPFFLVGDTWYSVGTFRWPWRDENTAYPIGPQLGVKDALRFRKEQGFNCIAIVAAHPCWANDAYPSYLEDADGTVIRAAWQQNGTRTAMGMHDEDGNRPFLTPGRAPEFPEVIPDFARINPAFFQSLDRKIRYMNAQGFVPCLEASRRDVGPSWRKYSADWPDSYVRYLRYLFARYQATNIIFSPLHLDYYGLPCTLTRQVWREAIDRYYAQYGMPPFGQPVTTNIDYSTLDAWGHRESAPWLTLHQVGNTPRGHAILEAVTRIYALDRPLPVLNGEPYYPGFLNADTVEMSARKARSAMYGNVMCGGLAGHIYGSEGLFGGDIEDMTNEQGERKPLTWEALQWDAGKQMQYMKEFMLSVGAANFQQLAPRNDVLDAPRELGEDFRQWIGLDFHHWSYCLRAPEGQTFLLYFEVGSITKAVSYCIPNQAYQADWFNPRTGEWLPLSAPLESDADGVIYLPSPPGGDTTMRYQEDWALKLQAC